MIFSVKIQEYLLAEDPRWKFIHPSIPSIPSQPFTSVVPPHLSFQSLT